MTDKIVRLGGASGFWGDTPEGARQLVYSGQVDYLVMDYLAEITMSLLARAKAKDPTLGYPADFVSAFIAPLCEGDRGARAQGHLQCRRREPALLPRRGREGAGRAGREAEGRRHRRRRHPGHGRGIAGRRHQGSAERRAAAGQDRHRQCLYRRLPDRRRAGRGRGYRRHRPRRRQRFSAGAIDP